MRSCVKCKSSEYNNRTFTLLINECGHSLCSNCVESLFARNSAPCPTCGKILRKTGYWTQVFEDPRVEREVFFRKKYKKVFNLKEEDFPSRRAFDDYLEEVETLMYNLATDTNLEWTNQRIEKFQVENASLIQKNKNKKNADELWIQRMLDEERHFQERQRALYHPTNASKTDASQQHGVAAVDSTTLIQELMNTDLPAELIVSNKRRELEKLEEREVTSKFSEATGSRGAMASAHRRFGQAFMPPTEQVGVPHTYQELVLDTNGPPVPSFQNLHASGYLKHVRSCSPAERAGGYREEYACVRALQDAFCDLYFLR